MLLLTGTGLSHEPSRARDARRGAARRARAGVPVVVDIDYRAGSMGRPGSRSPPQMQTLLRSATLAVGTEEEARRGVRRRPTSPAALATILDSGIQALVLKRGAARVDGVPRRRIAGSTWRRFRSRS